MARLDHVERRVGEIGPVKAFYESAAGWALTAFGPTYACTLTGDTDLGLQRCPDQVQIQGKLAGLLRRY